MQTATVHRTSRFAALTLAAIVATALGGCSSTPKSDNPPAVINASIKEASAQQATYIAKGDVLVVKLPTQGGVHYAWRLTPESFDNDFVKLLERRPQQTPEGRMADRGQPACDVFTFHAKKPGQCSLEFVYDWPWNPTAPPAKRFMLDIGVTRPDGTTEFAQAK